MSGGVGEPIVVLDDDPTGAQAVESVPIVLECDDKTIAAALESRPAAVHVVTNSRALAPPHAYEVVRDVVSTVARVSPHAQVLLRGDSTLRAHFLEEYLAVRDAWFSGQEAVVLLVPALPAAGRVTVGGVHLLEREGRRVALDRTEYAEDPAFAYRTARLLDWAEERSKGHFRSAAGVEIPLDELRERRSGLLMSHLVELADAGAPAVVVPDAESVDDLNIIADAYRSARIVAKGRLVVRCSPTFVGVLCRNLATQFVPVPRTRTGAVVVCGSYVPTSTRQLAELAGRFSHSVIEVDVDALTAVDPTAEVRRLALEASRCLPLQRLVVIATPRSVPRAGWNLDRQQRLAWNLGRVVRSIEPAPDIVVAKGGITSAITARAAFGARRAEVVGPVADGVALWNIHTERGGTMPYVVFPGNVGDDKALRVLVEGIVGQEVTDPA